MIIIFDIEIIEHILISKIKGMVHMNTINHFNKNKSINAVLFIAGKIKTCDFHKTFKILYFSDREHLSEYGRSITGDTYIAMQDGPVPTNLFDIFKSVRGDGYFKDKGNFATFFKVTSWNIINPILEPNLKTLSKTDIEILASNVEIYGKLSWQEIRDISHDYAWENTSKDRPMKIKDILLEAGNDSSYLDYINMRASISKSF
jgi:uncharacterized phage-associated protein